MFIAKKSTRVGKYFFQAIPQKNLPASLKSSLIVA
jgi:hypothetical protein